MEQAIQELKERLSAELDSYHEGFSFKNTIATYVEAINVLELHCYGEKLTKLETVLY